MGKAELLTSFLAAAATDRVILSFRQVELLLGHALPPESRGNEAWWRDSDDANEVVAALKAAGFDTSHVTLDGEKIEMGREDRIFADRHNPLFGAFRNKVELPKDLDLTEPADPEWGTLHAD